ncbi:MAG: hypothetical protein ACI8QZ_001169 [Chlamydiales bacterium]|jgi:hypothetical protein
MFIVWGTKIKRKPVGRVADYCMVCHAQRAFRLVRVGAAGHVYYLSFGAGKLAGHEAVCESCKTSVATEFERYCAVSTDRNLPLDVLVRETQPELERRSSERRTRELRVGSGDATAVERRDMLMEPFLLVNSMIEQQQSNNALSKNGRRAATVMLLLLVALMVVMGSAGSEESQEQMGAAVGLALVLSFIVFLGFWATSMRSFIRTEAEPRIVRALTPFKPAPEELASILQHLKAGGLASGRRLKAERLRAAFATFAMTPGAGSGPDARAA